MKTPLLDKIAGKVLGVPDATGPYGRGAGPGGGRADGSGLAGVAGETENKTAGRVLSSRTGTITKINPDGKLEWKPTSGWKAVPDATGPHGRGAGPGQGTKSGLGLIMAKMEKGEKLTEEEQAILESARGKIKK